MITLNRVEYIKIYQFQKTHKDSLIIARQRKKGYNVHGTRPQRYKRIT